MYSSTKPLPVKLVKNPELARVRTRTFDKYLTHVFDKSDAQISIKISGNVNEIFIRCNLKLTSNHTTPNW